MKSGKKMDVKKKCGKSYFTYRLVDVKILFPLHSQREAISKRSCATCTLLWKPRWTRKSRMYTQLIWWTQGVLEALQGDAIAGFTLRLVSLRGDFNTALEHWQQSNYETTSSHSGLQVGAYLNGGLLRRLIVKGHQNKIRWQHHVKDLAICISKLFFFFFCHQRAVPVEGIELPWFTPWHVFISNHRLLIVALN